MTIVSRGQGANVSLIGYRASGKSAVAAPLAAALGWEWVDTDLVIESRAGKSIASIFAEDGEAAFRDRESKVLMELTADKGRVIAAGGGAILRRENRVALRAGGLVVWLQADPAILWRRISMDPVTPGRRPDLAGGGENEVREVLAQREPLYRETADVTIDASGRSPEAIAAEIVDVWTRSRTASMSAEIA